MFFIKDLKDLENDTTRVSIDIKDLKDLKRIVTIEIAGDRPPRYGCQGRFPFLVGRGPSDAIRASERVSLAIARATEKMSLQVRRTLMSIVRESSEEI